MARPSKHSPEVERLIVSLLEAGNTVETAAGAAGISPETFYDWMRRGLRDGKRDAKFRAFRAAVEQARSMAEATLVTRISKAAANGSWQAAAWLLERRSPEQWLKPTERGNARGNKLPDEPRDPFAELDTEDEVAKRREAKGKQAEG